MSPFGFDYGNPPLTAGSDPACGVLYIDDEEKTLKYFRSAFGRKFQIFTAASGPEGLELLRQNASRIGVVVCDQRMPGMFGTQILETVRQEHPGIVRILTTAFADVDSMEAINRGRIFQYVVKPWEIPALERLLEQAADEYRRQHGALPAVTMRKIVCGYRLQSLMLCARSWSEQEQSAWSQAILAFLQALPGHPGQAATEQGRPGDGLWDTGTLIHDEYAGTARCLDAIDAMRRGDSMNHDYRLKALIATLTGAHGITAEEIAFSIEDAPVPAVQIQLKPISENAREDLTRALFGLFLEREIPELSLQLLGMVYALSTVRGHLSLSIGSAHELSRNIDFPMSSDTTVGIAEAIGILYRKVSGRIPDIRETIQHPP